jgi:hypothetical protein
MAFDSQKTSRRSIDEPPFTGHLHRQLIAKSNIVFEGPQPLQNCPAQYADIFAKILDVNAVSFDESRFDSDTPYTLSPSPLSPRPLYALFAFNIHQDY